MKPRALLTVLSITGLFLAWTCVRADDDDDEHDERAAERHEGEHQGGRPTRDQRRKNAGAAETAKPADFAPASNAVYTDRCAACHFAYPPGLLPVRSWDKVLSALPEHFGETVDLDLRDKAEISAYLRASAAEHTRSSRAARILRSATGATPGRITEIPYIREKHDEISPAVLKRKAVGSLSNCNACHQQATRGVFEEDDVRIPRA